MIDDALNECTERDDAFKKHDIEGRNMCSFHFLAFAFIRDCIYNLLTGIYLILYLHIEN